MADKRMFISYEEREKMVKAMEFIARQVNDGDVFERWLMGGVADGDIKYGDLTVDRDNPFDDPAFVYVKDDKQFGELMECFLRLMKSAYKSGGLYCDGVVTREE